MPGPRPKDPAARRRQNAPTRGEWVEIADPAPDAPNLPDYREWSARTHQAWNSWWADPASGQWSESDRDLVLHLAELFEGWQNKNSAVVAAEIRQTRDSLGLSPKGRQDRRWRIPKADVVELETRSAVERMEELRKLAAATEGAA